MQHYVEPWMIAMPDGTPQWPSRGIKAAIARDGQIVPLLVKPLGSGGWIAADKHQGERLRALRELNFKTALIEDEWEEEDL